MNEKSIFEKIINREIPTKIIFEDEELIVINDINPQAPIHFLLIPKKKFINVGSMELEDSEFIAHLFRIAQHLSKTVKGAEQFRLICNSGKKAGQTVFHFHMHFLAGF